MGATSPPPPLPSLVCFDWWYGFAMLAMQTFCLQMLTYACTVFGWVVCRLTAMTMDGVVVVVRRWVEHKKQRTHQIILSLAAGLIWWVHDTHLREPICLRTVQRRHAKVKCKL